MFEADPAVAGSDLEDLAAVAHLAPKGATALATIVGILAFALVFDRQIVQARMRAFDGTRVLTPAI